MILLKSNLDWINLIFIYRKFVRNSIAQVVATVAKHDLPKNQWPQLFQFILLYTKSQNSAEREVSDHWFAVYCGGDKFHSKFELCNKKN